MSVSALPLGKQYFSWLVHKCEPHFQVWLLSNLIAAATIKQLRLANNYQIQFECERTLNVRETKLAVPSFWQYNFHNISYDIHLSFTKYTRVRSDICMTARTDVLISKSHHSIHITQKSVLYPVRSTQIRKMRNRFTIAWLAAVTDLYGLV